MHTSVDPHWNFSILIRAEDSNTFVLSIYDARSLKMALMCNIADELKDRPTAYSHPRSGNLLPQEREEVGSMCKQLIDFGRADYLKRHGFHCELKEFIDKYYTLENCCLLAKKE